MSHNDGFPEGTRFWVVRSLSRNAGLAGVGGIYQFRHFGLVLTPAGLKWGKFKTKVEFSSPFISPPTDISAARSV
jgi:hypothetical protein